MKKRIFSLALASTMVLGSFGSVMAADEEVELLTNKPFIDGYEIQGEEKNEFRPDGSATRAEMSKILFAAFEIAKGQKDFPDVKVPTEDEEGHWAYEFIGALGKAGYIEGYPDGNFLPENKITRAELAKIISEIYKDKGNKIEGKDVEFTDIEDHWAKEVIQDMAKAGIIQGYGDDTFRPEKEVTRAEAVEMVFKALGRKMDPKAYEKLDNNFSDVSNEAWYVNQVLEASNEYQYKVVDGVDEIVVEEPEVEEIESVAIKDQAFASKSTKKVVKVQLNGTSKDADLDKFKADGYEFEFRELDKDGKIVENSVLFGTDGKETGKLADDIDLGKYTIEVSIAKNGKFITKGKGTITIIDENAEGTSDIKSIKFVTKEGIEVVDYKVVAGEELTLKELIAKIGDKDEVNVLADGLDYELESSNSDIVKVNSDKKTLEAVSEGTAKLTFKVGKITKEVEMKVANKKDARQIVSFKADDIKLMKGKEKEVEITLIDQYGAELTSEYGKNLEFSKLDGLTITHNKGVIDKENTITVISNEDSLEGKIYVSVVDRDGDSKRLGSIPVSISATAKEKTAELVRADGKKGFEIDLSSQETNAELLTLKAVIKYDGHDSADVANITSVSSSNPEFATAKIDANGDIVVTGVKAGKATIKANIEGIEGEVVKEITVKGLSEYSVTSVEFNDEIETNILGEYKLDNFFKNIKHDVQSALPVTIKDAGNEAILYVGEKQVGKIEFTGDVETSEIVSQLAAATDKKELKDVVVIDLAQATGKKASFTITVKKNNDEVVKAQAFSLDASGK